MYDDYKFVTGEELEKLGLNSLVGTSALRPYMHGFFIDQKLHSKAVSLSQPFAYEQCVASAAWLSHRRHPPPALPPG